MLYRLDYLLAMACASVDVSTVLTKANSVSVRWLVDRKVIANEMRQENKIVIFLDYNKMESKTNNKSEGYNGFIQESG